VSAGLTFQHADGAAYGQPVSAQSASAYTKAFSALRSMGFRETEARRALEQVRQVPGMEQAELKEVVRRALQTLGEFRTRSPRAGAVRRSSERPVC
jgi:Holliday junction resolvasome RuvABC DNA-binding subunit